MHRAQRVTGPRRRDVPQRLRAPAPEGCGGGDLLPQDAGRGRTVLGPDGPMTQRFVEAVKSFAARSGIEIVSFRCGERKDDRTLQYRRHWAGGEGVLYIGKAQEKQRWYTPKAAKRRSRPD